MSDFSVQRTVCC